MAPDTAVATAGPDQGASRHGPLFRFLFVHEIDEYPAGGKRTGYLALAVLATIVLYYTYFTQTGVTPQIPGFPGVATTSTLFAAAERHTARSTSPLSSG